MTRTFWTLALGAALALAPALPAAAAPHAGDAAPSFTLPRTAGAPLDSAKLNGKPVYLNFFASWCGPCNAEAPDVARLSRKYRSRHLTVVGVNELENPAKAAEFAKKFGWPFDVVVDDGRVGKAYGAIALPVHVFIDKRGKVSTYRLGEMNASEIESAIKKIL